jgi:hypothetical protein
LGLRRGQCQDAPIQTEANFFDFSPGLRYLIITPGSAEGPEMDYQRECQLIFVRKGCQKPSAKHLRALGTPASEDFSKTQ